MKVKENFHITLSIKSVAILLICSGLILLTLSVVFTTVIANSFWATLFMAIGGTLFTIGLLNIIETFSNVERRISQVIAQLYGTQYLLNLSDDSLIEIRNNTTQALAQKRFRQNGNEAFINNLDNAVLDTVLSDFYIKNYEIDIYLSVDKVDESYVHKTIKTRIEYEKVVNKRVEIFPINVRNMIDIPNKTIFHISECKVNNTDVAVSSTQEKITDGSRGLYNTRLKNDLVVILEEHESVAEVAYTLELILPVDDHVSTTSLKCPCEKFLLNLFYIPDGEHKVKLSGNAFCAFATKSVSSPVSNENHLQIKIDGTLLNGDGIALHHEVVKLQG